MYNIDTTEILQFFTPLLIALFFSLIILICAKIPRWPRLGGQWRAINNLQEFQFENEMNIKEIPSIIQKLNAQDRLIKKQDTIIKLLQNQLQNGTK